MPTTEPQPTFTVMMTTTEEETHAAGASNCSDPVYCRRDFTYVIDMIINASKAVKIPGLAISVVYDQGDQGGKIWTKGVGIRNLNPTDNEVNPNVTKFAVGSISKSFTTSLICILLDQNRDKYPNGWDTTLKDVLGSNFSLSSESCHHSSTIKDVLAHRMALKSYSVLLLMGANVNKPVLEFCRRMNLLETDGDFRITYTYSNMMYILAGCIAEIIGGDSFSNLLKKKLLEPLKMHDTVVIEDSKKVGWANLSDSFYMEDDRLKVLHTDMLRVVEMFPSAGGILSTALDMTKWIKFHFNFGKLEDGRQLVDHYLWSEMHKSHMPMATFLVNHEFESYPVPYSMSYYELGWMMSRYRDERASVHGGRISGFDSFISVYPSRHFGIFTTTNGLAYNNFDFQKAAHLVLFDLFNWEKVWLDNTTMARFDQSFRGHGQSKSIHPDKSYELPSHSDHTSTKPYVGIYGHQLLGNMTIYSKNHKAHHHQRRSRRQRKVDDLYFQYGLVGSGKLLFLSNDSCSIHFLDYLDHFNHIETAHYYKFKFNFTNFNQETGRFDGLIIFSAGEKALTTFRRGLKWHTYAGDGKRSLGSEKKTSAAAVALAIALHVLTKH